MSDISITYGSDLFLNVGTQPIVSIATENIYSNGSMHSIDTVTLNGRIRRANCGESGMKDPYDRIKTLVTRLSTGDKKNLSITETIGYVSSEIHKWSYAIPVSVSIEDNVWYDWIPYSIEFKCYQYGYFESNGVIDPSREVSVENNSDGTLNLTIKASCKGQTSSSQAIENARLFVYDNSSILSFDLENLFWTLDVIKTATPHLLSEDEVFNRFTGEASITRTYVLQDKSLGFSRGVLKFTRDSNTDKSGETTVSIKGEHQGGFKDDTTKESFEDDIKDHDWYSIANNLYKEGADSGDLFTSPVNFSFQRNFESNSISFSIEFSNKKKNDIYTIDSTKISDNFEVGKKCVDVSLEIRSDLKCKDQRWSSIVSYYSELNFQAYVQERWERYGNSETLNLNTRQGLSYSENQFESFIQVGGTFCVDDGQSCGCLEDMNYNYSFVPALKEYKISSPNESQGCHYIEDLRIYKRSIFSIQGTALSAVCCSYEKTVLQLKSRLNQVCNSMFYGSKKVLDSVEISKQSSGGEISFSASWSAKKDPIIPEELL